jgi:hypothetical protein
MGSRMITYFTVHRMVTFFMIFFLSFTIRVSLLIRHRDDIDAVGEEPRIAYALISKGQFADPYVVPTGPTAHSTPFFPVLLAGIYKVLGTGFAGQVGRCLLIITGYSLLFALYPTFASAFGFPFQSGLFAGFISALLPLRRSAEVFRGWEETWAAMALALLLFLTLKRYKSPTRGPMSAVGLGACWGAALYINFALSAVLVGLLFVELLSHRTLRVLRDACITLIAVVVVISPWVLRNHTQLHGWTLMRSNLGLEIGFGNHEHAYPSAELIAESPASFRHPGQSVQEAMLVRDLGEINYNRRDLHAALMWMRGNPGTFIWLSIERFLFFWLGPLNHAYESIVISSYTLLGLAGVAFIRTRVGEIQFRMWCTVLVFYPLMYYCVAFAHRYRVPIDWMIWLPAGLFICVVFEKFTAERAALPVRTR